MQVTADGTFTYAVGAGDLAMAAGALAGLDAMSVTVLDGTQTHVVAFAAGVFHVAGADQPVDLRDLEVAVTAGQSVSFAPCDGGAEAAELVEGDESIGSIAGQAVNGAGTVTLANGVQVVAQADGTIRVDTSDAFVALGDAEIASFRFDVVLRDPAGIPKALRSQSR